MSFDLARLIHPVVPDIFKRDYWERRPLLVARNDPRYFRDLLSLADLDRILSTSGARPPDLRLLREGNEIPLGVSTHQGHRHALEAVYEHYRDGSTIALQFLHERYTPLQQLCQALAAEFSASFQVNAYLTPAYEQGLHTHYDTHDVFVLQTEGVKHWRVFQETFRLPLQGQPFRRAVSTPGELIMEVDLRPGDCLYFPRGFCHDATATDSTSLHLTVGAQTVTWAAVLIALVETAIARDSRFRESLPPGFADDPRAAARAEDRLLELLRGLGDQVDPKSVIRDVRAKVLAGRRPFLNHHLLDLEGLGAVTAITRVKRRSEVSWHVTEEDGTVALSFHSKVVKMPAFVKPCLMYLLEADEFSARDLPGDLDEAGQLVLVKRLLREGLLTLCR